MFHVAFTGHRPNKLGGYSQPVRETLGNFAITILKDLAKEFPKLRVISGMALGWDQAVAIAATRLRIPVTAAIPCANHESRWPEDSQTKYRQILDHPLVDTVLVSQDNYSARCMQARNEWMVDNSQLLVALWNGTPGGTANCVKYAESKQHDVANCWPAWERYKTRRG